MESPVTRRSLLLRVRDPADDEAWTDFVLLYAPLLHAYAMRRGFQDADAADVTQQVLYFVARAVSGFDYDPGKGSFRGWLFTIARNQIIRTSTRAARAPLATGSTDFHAQLAQQADIRKEEDIWNREHQRQLFRWAAEKVKTEFQANTWMAFREKRDLTPFCFFSG